MARKLVVVAVAALALALAASGLAAVHRYKTKFTLGDVTVSGGQTHHPGRVKSTKAGCVKHRKVTLYEKRTDHPDKVFGRDTTDRKGHFQIDVPFPTFLDDDSPGTYFQAPKRSHPNYVCNAGRSKLIPAGN